MVQVLAGCFPLAGVCGSDDDNALGAHGNPAIAIPDHVKQVLQSAAFIDGSRLQAIFGLYRIG